MVKVALEVLELAAGCAILGVEQRFMTALALAVTVASFLGCGGTTSCWVFARFSIIN